MTNHPDVVWAVVWALVVGWAVFAAWLSGRLVDERWAVLVSYQSGAARINNVAVAVAVASTDECAKHARLLDAEIAAGRGEGPRAAALRKRLARVEG